jgi:hypothetical protein
VAPECRIVYVDNDPVVLAHARALLTSTPEGATAYLDADLRDPDTIVRGAARTLDFTQPIAIMLMGILGHIADDDEARSIVKRLLGGVPSGSYLAMNDGTDTSEEVVEAARIWNQSANPTYHLRSPDRIARFFDDLELVEPGVVSPHDGVPSPVCPASPPRSIRRVVSRASRSACEGRLLAGLGDDPPSVRPPHPDRPLLVKVGGKNVQDLPAVWRRHVIGRIIRLLWRSPNDAGAGCAPIWRAAITVTEPIGAALDRLALRKFVKSAAQRPEDNFCSAVADHQQPRAVAQRLN